MMPYRDRDRGFSDPAGADDGDNARCGQLSGQPKDVFLSADHAAQAVGKIGVREIGGTGGHYLARTARSRDWCHKAIAPSWECRDVSRAILPIAQRLAEAVHVK